MSYLKGTKFNKWLVTNENQRGKIVATIRRWVIFPDQTKKLERLPVQKYRHFRDNPDELNKLIVRLNTEVSKEQRTREAVEIKHAYISPALLEDYKSFLEAQIPSKKQANTEYACVVKHFLFFFIGKLNLSNPLQWHLCHKTEWATYLQSKDVPKSRRSLSNIINGANRFMGWLHERRPTEVPPLKFQPISKAKYKSIEADRERDGKAREPKMITDTDWATIKLKADHRLTPFILIAYHYGLRRSETLGLSCEDVRKGYLSVERQLKSFADKKPMFSILKGKEMRRVPHWASTPDEIYKLISQAVHNCMHPDTLSDIWFELMHSLNLDYTFHDIRHTWITKCARLHNVRDVQLAAGHKDLKTTMGYLHDDRTLEDQKFVPVAS